jgi:hypothetical protein
MLAELGGGDERGLRSDLEEPFFQDSCARPSDERGRDDHHRSGWIRSAQQEADHYGRHEVRARRGPKIFRQPERLKMTKTAILFGLILAAAGCNKDNASTAPADNTNVNERDRNTAALTPGDQGENEVDRTITQKIRQGVMKNDTLSMTAKNVKIITANSVVTLRGPVKNDKEKADIVAIAQGTDGVKRVDNQLEVAAN